MLCDIVTKLPLIVGPDVGCKADARPGNAMDKPPVMIAAAKSENVVFI